MLMTKTTPTERDERTATIENASYGLAYKVLAFGLLLDVMYRSLRFGNPTWDLLGLVLVSGVVLTAYQSRHAILGKSWTRLAVLAVVTGLIIAALTALLRLRK